MYGKTFIPKLMLTAAALVAAASPASAQWSATAIGVAEYDTEQTVLVLGGLSLSPGGRPIAPLFGVQAHYLTYEVADERRNVTSVRPYAGLRSSFTGGSLYGTVGYAFTSREGAPGTAFTVDRGDGVVVSGGLDHWGTGGPLGYQLLGSYNFGTESFWGRGRVTTRISQSGPSQTRLGGEVALISSNGFQAWQPGLVAEFHNGNGQIIGVGAGAKLVENGDNAIYVKLEAVLPLLR
jgi:hypothetical protein